ncbi:MAG: peptidase inhibitor [Herbaspirillum sp.]|nr:peptidase inhibitor [Herbaspirillum sp.]
MQGVKKPVTSDRSGFFCFQSINYNESGKHVPRLNPAALHLPALLGAAVILAACSASREPQATETAASGRCDAARVEHLIGEDLSGYVERQAQAESGAADIRVLKPGDAATMDFNLRRLNIHVDPSGVIIKVACG